MIKLRNPAPPPPLRSIERMILGGVAGFVVMAIVMGLGLSGCAAPGIHVDAAPPPPPKIVYVDRPVPVGCIKAGAEPAPPADVGGLLNRDAVHDALILGAKDESDHAWQGTIMALLKACEIPARR